MTRLGVLIATAGGAGYFPIAPGTVGSAVGILLVLLTDTWSPIAQIALLAVVTIVGVWSSRVAAIHFNREDPGYVVIDEVAGQLLTVLLLDLSAVGLFTGFLLFRILDIVKPWPARGFEDLPGGWGVMADDLMVGVYGWLIMWALVSWLPAVF